MYYYQAVKTDSVFGVFIKEHFRFKSVLNLFQILKDCLKF